MTNKKKVRPHVKMYADDEFISALQQHAKEEGLTQSALIFTTMKKIIKRNKK